MDYSTIWFPNHPVPTAKQDAVIWANLQTHTVEVCETKLPTMTSENYMALFVLIQDIYFYRSQPGKKTIFQAS